VDTRVVKHSSGGQESSESAVGDMHGHGSKTLQWGTYA
jgi:hypothetical protein